MHKSAKQKKTIVFLGYGFLPDRIEAVKIIVYDLAKKLAQRNYEIVIITAADTPIEKQKISEGVHLYAVPFRKTLNPVKVFLSSRRFIDEAVRIINENHAALIHDHFVLAYSSRLSIKIARRTKLPLVKTFRVEGFKIRELKSHFICTLPWLKEYLFKLILDSYLLRKIIAAHIHYLVVSSSGLAYEFRQYHPQLLYDGVGDHFFKIGSKIRTTSSSPHRVLYLGHPSRKKGVEYLIQAINSVAERIPEVVFSFAFSNVGKDKRFFEEILKKQNIDPKKIEVMGVVSPGEAFGKADIFVLPLPYSWSATSLPLSAVESLACGTPIIISDRGSHVELVKGNETGFLLKDNFATEIATYLNRYLSDQELVHRMKHEATNFAKKFHWDYTLDKYEDLYQKILGAINA